MTTCELCGHDGPTACHHVSDGIPSDDHCPACGRCCRPECNPPTTARQAKVRGEERIEDAIPGARAVITYTATMVVVRVDSGIAATECAYDTIEAIGRAVDRVLGVSRGRSAA
jgi:hypothetical protein